MDHAPSVELVERGLRTLHHRGPDAQASVLEGPIALGHARLSILDLSEHGNQPMQSPDGGHHLVYNGELYNFKELKAELESLGCSFRGSSDSEVVLHALRVFGPQALGKFHGMFALAFWDRAQKSLLLARDRFGIKPLYTCFVGKRLMFASEIKALLAMGAPRAPSMQAMHELFYFNNALGPRTMFEHIEEFPPAHYRIVSQTGQSDHRFWSIPQRPKKVPSFEEARVEVRRRLRHAVERHLQSDVPLGLFLSGGIDSSSILALAAERLGGDLRTYSVGFDFEKGVDERPAARALAQRFGTQHQELTLRGGDLPKVIQTLVRAHDEPFGDAANIPLYLMSQALKGEIKVVLQGDGGDEIFAGYRRYNLLSYRKIWRIFSYAHNHRLFRKPPHAAFRRIGRILDIFSENTKSRQFARLLTTDTPSHPPIQVLSTSFKERLRSFDPFERYAEILESVETKDPVQAMLHIDAQIILPDTFLEKVDKSTMAASIESRVPFLDAELCDYVMPLPSHYKVQRGQKKFLLRQAMRGLVPDSILDAKKTGFGVPYSHWLRTSLSDFLKDTLFSQETTKHDIFNNHVLESMIARHQEGDEAPALTLYRSLQLALWFQIYQ